MGSLSITIPIGLIIFAAAFIQSAAGFGYGIVAIPLLTAFCLVPEIALPLSATTAVAQSLYGVIRFRKKIRFREVLVYSVYCNSGMILGVLALRALTRFNQDLFSLVIGILLLLVLAVRMFLKPVPRDSVSWYWGFSALFVGGFICGIAGIGGPIIVIWILAHKWENLRVRTTLWSVFLFMTSFQIFMYIFIFGSPAFRGFISGLALIPVVLAASFVGILFGNSLSSRKLAAVITAIVMLTAVYSIVKPLI